MRVERVTLEGRTDGRDYQVNVTDNAGNLVCWGGPYDNHEAREAIELFTGKKSVKPAHDYRGGAFQERVAACA